MPDAQTLNLQFQPSALTGGGQFKGQSGGTTGQGQPASRLGHPIIEQDLLGDLENIASNIPTLILAGQYDPITPPAWGQVVAEGLANSYFYQFPGVGHGASLAGECPISVMEAFWTEPTQEPAAACIAEMAGPQFVPDDAAAAITLVPFASETFGITGVVPEGWTQASPGVYVRGSTALDRTVIIQQAVPGVSAEDLLQLVTGQLGLAEAPTSTEKREIGGYTWTFYQAEAQGSLVDIALTRVRGQPSS